MKFDNAYVISYIHPGWNEKTRAKRFDAHRKQIDWLKAQGFNVFVFAQYEGEHKDVTYLPFNGQRHLPGNARNRCLDHFYSSDEDFCLLLDDDIILYDDRIYSGNIKEKLGRMDFLLSENISLMCPVFPAFDPYTQFIKEYGSVFPENLILKNKPAISGQFLVLKNLKKHYNKPIFFNETWAEADGSVKLGEDALFSLEVTKHGFGTYKMWNWMVNDMGVSTSTHVNKETIKERYRSLNRELASIFNLRVKDPGGQRQLVYWSEFGIKCGNRKEWVIPFNGDVNEGLESFMVEG